MSSSLLSITHLSIQIQQYQRGLRRRILHPLRDLSLSLEAGELLAIAGASGSGKSLLASAILGLLPYNARCSGEISYQGETLTPPRQAMLRGQEISLVPQSIASLDPLMKIGAQMCHGDRSPDTRERSLALLARYGLRPEVAELYPFQLSGGMARRVLIAMALMPSPRLVIADEPTPGLDLPTARRVLSHFRELSQEGVGVLLITHDLPLALEVAQRVCILYEGEKIEEAPSQLFSQPENLQHPYSRALLAASPANGLQVPAKPFFFEEMEQKPLSAE